MTTFGIAGANGFVGRAVCRELDRRGIAWRALPRCTLTSHFDAAEAAKDPRLSELRKAVQSSDAVINAAGLAAPTSSDNEKLQVSNVVLPLVLGHLCANVGIRMVHVSSAAVQGTTATLDETSQTSPSSPYASSKAEAERLLTELHHSSGLDLSIYRATSVMGAERQVTQSMARLFSGAISPIVGMADAPLPLATVDNTASATVSLATCPAELPSIALHPYEGVTLQSLADACRKPGSRRIRLPLPGSARRVFTKFSALPAPIGPGLRRLELVAFGQSQSAEALGSIGFAPNDDVHDLLRSVARKYHQR